MKYYAYAGKIGYVDLSNRIVEYSELDGTLL